MIRSYRRTLPSDAPLLEDFRCGDVARKVVGVATRVPSADRLVGASPPLLDLTPSSEVEASVMSPRGCQSRPHQRNRHPQCQRSCHLHDSSAPHVAPPVKGGSPASPFHRLDQRTPRNRDCRRWGSADAHRWWPPPPPTAVKLDINTQLRAQSGFSSSTVWLTVVPRSAATVWKDGVAIGPHLAAGGDPDDEITRNPDEKFVREHAAAVDGRGGAGIISVRRGELGSQASAS